MYGRYGGDKFSLFLLVIALVLSLFGGLFWPITLLADAVFIYVLFRMFSRNLPKRRAENQRWVNWWWRVKNSGSASRARHADKDHKYFVCKNCKTICRVPVGKGKIIITCPKCGAQIHAKT